MIAHVARTLYRSLLPESAKNTLRVALLFDERDKPPQEIERFDDGPVLVLAPHMDDEVLGCGGAVRRHVLAGARVRVLFLTDGAASEQHLAEPVSDPSALSATRKAESQRAAEVLGVGELEFLDAPDGALTPTDELVGRVAAAIDELAPRVVYSPSLFDTHEDHWATALVLGACAERLARDARVRQYEVWTPLVVNRLVDIGDVLDDKRKALEAFESQLPHLDLVRLADGLSAYRSIHKSGGRGHAEAFYESTPDAYRELLDRCRARR